MSGVNITVYDGKNAQQAAQRAEAAAKKAEEIQFYNLRNELPAPEDNVLPSHRPNGTPVEEGDFMEVKKAVFVNLDGTNLEVTDDKGRLWFDGDLWKVSVEWDLPVVPVTAEFGDSVTEAAAQKLVTDIKDTVAKEVESETYIWAIVDDKNKVLLALRSDGSLYWNTGLSTSLENTISQINQSITTINSDMEVIDGWKVIDDDNYLFTIVDAEDKVIFAIDPNLKIINPDFNTVKAQITDLSTRVIALENEEEVFSVPDFKNPPLPRKPAVFKILGIGNSFTEDGMQNLPGILAAAGVSNVTLGKLSYGGTSLQQQWDFYQNSSPVYSYAKSTANSWNTVSYTSTFTEAVQDEDWDLIILQQVSQNSGIWSTIEPYIYNLIDAVVTNCPNPGVTLGWHSTWAYATNSTHPGFSNYNNNQQIMLEAIQNVAKKIVSRTGIDVIIPAGMAIQNLRTTSVNNPPDDLTADGFHLDGGIARLTAGYAWFEKIIGEVFGLSVLGNSYNGTAGGSVAVTPENKVLAQWAAKYACSRRFSVTEVENMINV